MGFDGFNAIEESDMIAMPDPDALAILPYRPQERSVARMFCDIRVPGGEPYEGDPGYVPRRALGRAKDMGLRPLLPQPGAGVPSTSGARGGQRAPSPVLRRAHPRPNVELKRADRGDYRTQVAPSSSSGTCRSSEQLRRSRTGAPQARPQPRAVRGPPAAPTGGWHPVGTWIAARGLWTGTVGGRPRIRAVRLHEFGGDPRVDEIPPPPPPGRGEILIDVSAVGVGAWDLGVREGRLARFLPDAPPFTMGAQLAGRVREIGPGVEGFAAGGRVVANPGIAGAWAETVRLPASACGRAPTTTDDGEAATLPVRALTAWQALELLDLPRGAALFVCGGGGAVGRAAIELAKGRGLRVLTIAGEDELEALRRLGADEAADYRGDWRARLQPSAREGVDAVLDLIGGDSLHQALGLVRPGGRAVTTISEASGIESPGGVAVEFLAMKSSTEDLDVIAGLVERGGLTAQVAQRYPLDQAAVALEAAASRNPADGDIVLEVAGRHGASREVME